MSQALRHDAGESFSPGGPIAQGRVIDSYPLSPLQQGMLFHWIRDPQSGVDLEQIGCTLDAIDPARFQRAWQSLARRHAALRTRFRWRDVDMPLQEVLDDVPLCVRELDLRAADADERLRQRDAFLDADRRTGFALDAAPLFRLTFLRIGEARYEFVWTFPHIILDGRSFVILLRELLELYRALDEGREPMLAPVRPYREFIAWLERFDSDAARTFWRDALSGFDTPTFPDLGSPAAGQNGRTGSREYDERSLTLSRDETSALGEFARHHGVTMNTIVQGAWALLLARYTGTDDVVFGATRACRRTALDGDAAADGMVGLFINTLPVRVHMLPDESVVEWLQRIRRDQVAVRSVEHTPLTLVQAASALPAGVSLFDTILVFENERQTVSFDAIDPRCRDFWFREKTSYPISLRGYAETELVLRIEYYAARFDGDAVGRMLDHLAMLLREIVAKGDRPIRDLDLLTTVERHRLLEEFAGPLVSFGGGETIVELLAAQVARSPDAIAVEDDRTTLTYAALDRAAARLARRLRARGVGAGTLAGVCAERSVELVVALVGVLKAGGAYVPLDQEYPRERLAFMVEDSGVGVVLASAMGAAALPPSAATILSLDGVAEEGGDEAPNVSGLPVPSRDDVAYMIYTSGSTGQPKGAPNAHRGIVNRLAWMQATYPLTANDVVLQKTPFSFDVSVPEFFWPLTTGARLVMARAGGHRDPAYIADVIRTHRVTVCHFVPSMLRAFLADARAESATTLRLVQASGEALPPDLVASFHRVLGHARLVNLYGPTECAVEVTHWLCPASVEPPAVVPIGRAIANTRLYVLDARGGLVPIGVPGELHLAGVQVGLGYHRRPQLTAERFVADPFAPADEAGGARMYRTGDRARWLSDGTVEYLGRLDFQVKLRGFRIELGEIEATLLRHPDVRDCVVVARADGGDQRLVAYFVGDGAPPTTAALRAHLLETLPDYMVPSAFVVLEALPLSSNGKVDRRALPAPESAPRDRVAVAPRDELEARLLKIWEQVIGRTGFGVTDGFNESGGNSLAAIRIVARIEQELGRQLQLVAMLKADTVEKLAALLRESAPSDEWSCIVPFVTTGDGVPIFCPHGRTGNVLVYQHFARAVGAGHPVYGLQARGNWGTQEPHESIEELAAYYAEEIVKVRPSGPYVFFGLSMGGWIALELARILSQNGHEVRMLANYDMPAPGQPHYMAWGRIAKYLREHGGIELSRIRELLRDDSTAGGALGRLTRGVGRVGREWRRRIARDWLLWKFEQRNPPHGYPLPPNITRFRLASRRIARRYVAKPYAGKLVLYRAEHHADGAQYAPDYGWGGIVSEVEVHTVPGGHVDGLYGEHVEPFARRFLADLARVSAERA
jgi:amino acid adenylation domain-containing protein